MGKFSGLPKDVICIIVSFLSAKSAAFTKILSKEWLNLFTIEPDLVYDQSNNNGETFQIFVLRLLNRPASFRIRRFSLKLQSLDNSQFELVNDCLVNVLKRGIMDLELDIKVKKGDSYLLPLEVFACKTVEKLKLGSGFAIDMIPRNALLPALKTLILDTVRFCDLVGCAFARLISACPVIDELVITGFNWEDWDWSHIVSSLTLKRLTIHRGDWEIDDYSESDTLSFDTPNLTHLEYHDVILYDYPIVKLNSIVEAKLSLCLRHFHHDYKLMNLINGLKNVQILCVDVFDTMWLLFEDSDAIPIFENLKHLSISTEPGQTYCWLAHRNLLEKSPNLETLTIEGLHYFDYDKEKLESVCECLDEYSFLWNCPIKVLTITNFCGEIGEMVQIKNFLEKLLHLEVLELRIQARDDEKVEIMQELLMFPRGSSKCQVQVKCS